MSSYCHSVLPSAVLLIMFVLFFFLLFTCYHFIVNRVVRSVTTVSNLRAFNSSVTVKTRLASVHHMYTTQAEHTVDHNHGTSTFRHCLKCTVFCLVTLAYYTLDCSKTYKYPNKNLESDSALLDLLFGQPSCSSTQVNTIMARFSSNVT